MTQTYVICWCANCGHIGGDHDPKTGACRGTSHLSSCGTDTDCQTDHLCPPCGCTEYTERTYEEAK